MAINLKTILVTGALITPSPVAFADVITDWNEKAFALVTPGRRRRRWRSGS